MSLCFGLNVWHNAFAVMLTTSITWMSGRVSECMLESRPFYLCGKYLLLRILWPSTGDLISLTQFAPPKKYLNGMGIVVQWLSCCLGYEHPISECLGSSSASASFLAFLLRHILGCSIGQAGLSWIPASIGHPGWVLGSWFGPDWPLCRRHLQSVSAAIRTFFSSNSLCVALPFK